jgi:hypothetical protein
MGENDEFYDDEEGEPIGGGAFGMCANPVHGPPTVMLPEHLELDDCTGWQHCS